MVKPYQIAEATRKVNAHRISTTDSRMSSQSEEVNVIEETPLRIDVEGIEQYTILCTPINKLPMAAGFLFSEGVIDNIDEFSIIEVCKDDPNVVNVKLTSDVPRIMDPTRNLLIISSCGACGTEDLNKRLEKMPKVGDSLRIKNSLLKSAMKDISEKQPLFNICGGTHLVAIINREGKIVAHAEDTGRHNALDKAIGKCLFAGKVIKRNWVVLTGRISLEMVSKCARAGLELISAISAPTSLAIDLAEQCGITLCAFVRKDRATVFTRRERVVGSVD